MAVNLHVTFLTYLAGLRVMAMSGLYLHSPASEGMWMEALQKHWNGASSRSNDEDVSPETQSAWTEIRCRRVLAFTPTTH